MAWFKVDDGFLTSSKVMSIPRSKRAEAIGVWLSVGVWSAHEMKDGIVPNVILEELAQDYVEAIADLIAKTHFSISTDEIAAVALAPEA